MQLLIKNEISHVNLLFVDMVEKSQRNGLAKFKDA